MAIVCQIGWETIALWAETRNCSGFNSHNERSQASVAIVLNDKTTMKKSHCRGNRSQHKVNNLMRCLRNRGTQMHKDCLWHTETVPLGIYCVRSGIPREIEGEAHNMPRRLRMRLGGPGRRIRCVIAQGGSDRECSINVTGENQSGGNWVDRMVVCLGYRRCDLVYGVCGGSCRERLAAHKR